MKHLTEKEQRCLNRALGKSTELISRGTLMKTEKKAMKAMKAAEKWAKQHNFVTDSNINAYIAGRMAEEEITPGPWQASPGHQPNESIGKRIDILCLDNGVIEDVEADYQDWHSRAMMDSIVKWRIYDDV